MDIHAVTMTRTIDDFWYLLHGWNDVKKLLVAMDSSAISDVDDLAGSIFSVGPATFPRTPSGGKTLEQLAQAAAAAASCRGCWQMDGITVPAIPNIMATVNREMDSGAIASDDKIYGELITRIAIATRRHYAIFSVARTCDIYCPTPP
jgi:hypothetical protein